MFGKVTITWHSITTIEYSLIQEFNLEMRYSGIGAESLREISPDEFQMVIPFYADPPYGEESLKLCTLNTVSELFIEIVTRANERLYPVPEDDEEEPEYIDAETWLEFLPVIYSQKTKGYIVPIDRLQIETWYCPEAYGQQRLF